MKKANQQKPGGDGFDMGLDFNQFSSRQGQKNEIDDFDFGGMAKNEEAKEDDFNFNFDGAGTQ